MKSEMQSVRWFLIDYNPIIQWNPHDNDDWEYENEVANLPLEWQRLLDRIVANTDNEECPNCHAPIGFVLYEWPDHRGTYWHSLAVCQNGTPSTGDYTDEPYAVCEDCSPFHPIPFPSPEVMK